MKKNFINFAMVAMVAFGTVAYTGCGKKGCTTEADDKYDSAATEEDPEACDPDGTTSKFTGPWTFTIAGSANTYSVAVTKTGDYAVTLFTNFGLNGVNAFNIPLTINQSTASSSVVDVAGTGNGDVKVDEFRVITTGSASLKATFSGFTTTSINGTYTDQGTK
jgi:predicted small lipoprotein YifL